MTAEPNLPAAVPRGRRMSPEARRAQIIAAAREVFLRHGFAGTRVRDIAEQAGITENLVYIRFATKAEIYEAAVTDPLDALVSNLVAATSGLAAGTPEMQGERASTERRRGRSGTGGWQPAEPAEPAGWGEHSPESTIRTDRRLVFERFHQVLLTSMLDTAPLLAVALFSDPAAGRRYYREVMLPRFTEAVTTVISDVTGWDLDAAPDVLVEGVLGLHFGLALDSIFDEHPLDTADVARQLGVIFGSGILDGAAAEARAEPTPAPAPEPTPEPATPPDQPTRIRMPAAERRADIARAAREVFVERGPAGARTKEIAERAGITEAFMFRVWAGKEELYREAIEEPAHQLMARLERDILDTLRSGDAPVATLRTLIERGITVLSELAPILVVALFSEMERGKAFYRRSVIPVLRQTREYLTGMPGWDTDEVDPDVLWRAVYGVQFGTVVHHLLSEEPVDAARVAQRLTRLIATGIR